MKNQKRMLFLIVALSLLISCSEYEETNFENLSVPTLKSSEKQVEKKKCMKGIITVPFRTSFVYTYTFVDVDQEKCGDYPMVRVMGNGSGTATHLGYFTTEVDFCANIETNEFNAPEVPVGSFVAANGDQLFYSTWGQTGPPNEDDPPHILERWEAPFAFTGGTGRFEGASGGGTYYGYNFLEDDNMYAHAIYTGMLILPKGNH